MTRDASPSRPPAFYRSSVGDMRVIALNDGIVSRERGEGFVRNAAAAEVEDAFSRLGLAPGQLTLTFTPLAVEANGKLVLIDTGFGENGPPSAGKLNDNLAAAGYAPGDVDTVLISHFHTDHIAGLVTKADAPAYPNARVLVPQPEWDYWMDDATMQAAPDGLKPSFNLCRRVFGALEGRIDRFGWDETVLPGIKSVCAAGHTPGQTAFEIGTGDDRLLFVADVTNNPFVFARHPTWQAAFDIQPDRAVETRQKLLADAAERGTRLFFFHAPFPGLGYVSREGDGYSYVPQIWGADA